MTINGQIYVPPTPDLVQAERSILCAPKCFMLAMPEPLEWADGIFRADKTARSLRLEVGVVVAAGSETGLKLGQSVLVEPKYARIVRNFRAGSFEYVHKEPGKYLETWMFGLTAPHVGYVTTVNPKESIIGLVEDSDYVPHGETPARGAYETRTGLLARNGETVPEIGGKRPQPCGRAILRLPERRTQVGSLYVPDNVARRVDVGVVESASSLCSFVQNGDMVCFARRALDLYPDGNKDLAVIREAGIYAVLQ